VQDIIQEFKTFLLRGNVVDLAVAVVIGTAFAAVVNSLVADLLTPLIAAVFGEPNFGALDFHINDSRFAYGNFLNAVFTFITIAAAVFFFVVKPVNMMRRDPAADPTTKACSECLSDIPVEARRCAFCAQPQAA
jgi:large conductance mechanosensitive channel